MNLNISMQENKQMLAELQNNPWINKMTEQTAEAVIGAVVEMVKEMEQEHNYNTSGINMDLINRADLLTQLTNQE